MNAPAPSTQEKDCRSDEIDMSSIRLRWRCTRVSLGGDYAARFRHPLFDCRKQAIAQNPSGQSAQEACPCISNDSLERRELVEDQPFHDLRVSGAETLIVFPRPPCEATPIHGGILCDPAPPPHFLADQDFFDLRSSIHLSLISQEKTTADATQIGETDFLAATGQ
jgi:hypothetical protein